MTVKFFPTGYSIFDADCNALVCPVNCDGVMGKGLALAFAKKYPQYEKHYRAQCRGLGVRPGLCNFYRLSSGHKHDFIVSFPTKRHWTEPSDYNLIAIGLGSLLYGLHQLGVSAVALPALGCGLGGLHWPTVKQYIETAERYMPEKMFEVYEPRA